MKIKQEVRRLGSRYLDGQLMYPGEHLFTWILLGAVWHLVWDRDDPDPPSCGALARDGADALAYALAIKVVPYASGLPDPVR